MQRSCGGFSQPIIMSNDSPAAADDAAGPRDGFSDYDPQKDQKAKFGGPPPKKFEKYEQKRPVTDVSRSGDRNGMEFRRRDQSPQSSRPQRYGQSSERFWPSQSGTSKMPRHNQGYEEPRRQSDCYSSNENRSNRRVTGSFDRQQRTNARQDYENFNSSDGPRRFNPSNRRDYAAEQERSPYQRRDDRRNSYQSFSNNNYDDRDDRTASDFGRLCQVRTIDWETMDLAPLVKTFYNECEVVKNRTNQEYVEWIEEHQILLHGENIPRPCFEFDEPGFPPEILRELQTNYDKPTLIQSISWPVALSGQDMVSIARTGSGKTLGFLLPAIVHTLGQIKRSRENGPTVLVLLPTRELAQQACDVASIYCRPVGLSVCAVFGGVARDQQQYELRRGVDVIIATPGRLLAFIHHKVISMNKCSFLVLDEADRMLEMGFEEQIRAIISQIRPDRQTLMFSATWPVEVRDFAKTFQTVPVFLNVGSLELSANHNIEQHICVIDERDKADKLEELLGEVLEKSEDGKVMVFFDTKRKADELESRLSTKYSVLCMHGDKNQQVRDQVMEEFKKGNSRVLLATDIAARGLDVSNVEAVINYDYPMSTEQYVHRIGRTARHEKTGLAYTFFTQHNSQRAGDLIKILEEAKQEVPEELRELAVPRHYY